MAPNNLPRLATFLNERLDRGVQVTDSSNCTICLERLRAPLEDNHDVVRLPCQHRLHFACLLKLTEGYTGNRNKCPNCREALFELNLLPPSKEALRRMESETYYHPTALFDTGLYTHLLTFTDNEFNEQLQSRASKGEEDYMGIPKAVRSMWIRSDLDQGTICEEHAKCDFAWLELVVAQRVRCRLEDAYMEDSWSGRIFMGALRVMKEMYEEQFRYSDHGSETEGRVLVMEEEEEEEEDHSDREPLRGSMNEVFPEAFAVEPGFMEQPSDTWAVTRGPEVASWISPQATEVTLVNRSVRGEPQLVLSAIPRPSWPSVRQEAVYARQHRRFLTYEEHPQQPQRFRTHFSRIRDRLEQDRIIVMELRNVASAVICGERMRRVRLLSGDSVGVIKDVDGYSTAGDLAIFWRWK